MELKKIQYLFSLLFIVGYMVLITIMLVIEASDSLNMIKGENSFQGELKILLGVLTAGVGQILSFWFGTNRHSDAAIAKAQNPNPEN